MDNMCSVDWEVLGSVLRGIGTFLTPFAAIYVARYWITQRKEEKVVEAASEMFSAVYQVQMALEAIREPQHWSSEREAAIESLENLDLDYDESRKDLAIAAMICHERLVYHQKTIDALLAVWPRAKAHLSKDVDSVIDPLLRIATRIESNCTIAMRMGFPDALNVIRSTGDDDVTKSEVNALVDLMESRFSKSLRST